MDIASAEQLPAVADKRAAIVAAANDLLLERGLDGLTIRAVLSRTGLARRAFYDLFATKDDLVLALFEASLSDAAALMKKTGRELDGPVDRLDLIIRTISVRGAVEVEGTSPQRDRRGAAFSREHMRLAQERPAELRRATKPLIDLIMQVVQEGIGEGQWHSADPSRSARFIYNLVSTTVQTELLDPGNTASDRAEREKLADQLVAFCVKSLSR
ncbi:TetR family transcriptional regulator [Altererythrobacter aquaemixtae]|uniref:TetR family transcriptional regulator n=1 Tax=Pontixanthobacter aquaemixtae TaxID=1958940 RepID=A0A844ZQF4_9SPHN|nr:TetR family transcriptional regulator [Pontixanthobacter aquaemixtae]